MKIQYRLEMQSNAKDSSPIEAGKTVRITINEAAELIFNIAKWRPRKKVHELEKPRDAAFRATNLENAEKRLG
jgi:hypothetical protein